MSYIYLILGLSRCQTHTDGDLARQHGTYIFHVNHGNCNFFSQIPLHISSVLSSWWTVAPNVQGGSNMTGTNCDLFTHNQSRWYLNHLVFNKHSRTPDKGCSSSNWVGPTANISSPYEMTMLRTLHRCFGFGLIHYDLWSVHFSRHYSDDQTKNNKPGGTLQRVGVTGKAHIGFSGESRGK
jgi:hypothetical protein